MSIQDCELVIVIILLAVITGTLLGISATLHRWRAEDRSTR